MFRGRISLPTPLFSTPKHTYIPEHPPEHCPLLHYPTTLLRLNTTTQSTLLSLNMRSQRTRILSAKARANADLDFDLYEDPAEGPSTSKQAATTNNLPQATATQPT